MKPCTILKICTLSLTITFLVACSSLPSIEQLFAASQDESAVDETGENAINQDRGIVDINTAGLNPDSSELTPNTASGVDAFGSIVKPILCHLLQVHTKVCHLLNILGLMYAIWLKT